MTPARLDADVVAARLRLISDTLEQLGALRGVTTERLRDEPLTRAAAERLLQVVVDLAVDVNAHLAVARLGRAPATGRDSFIDAAELGAIDDALAGRIAPAAGLRNVLVHRYLEIRIELIAEAVGEVLDGFATYVGQVAGFVHDSATPGPD